MLFALALSVAGVAQPLFTIDGKDVSANEFRRECRDFVEVADTFGLYSLMIDYADYRLVVQEAKSHSYDTSSQFRNAMQYYGNMLMYEHVVQNSRSQSIINNIFQHSAYQYKVWAARVDIDVNSGRDTSAAYKKALRLIDRINNGRRFEDVAIQISDSPQTKYNGGYMGWVSPIDFHVGAEAEDYIFAHYNDTAISSPIRCGNSYYVIKTGGRRSAIAEVDVSPIIIRKTARLLVNDSLRTLMENISQDIKSGKDFDDLQQRYSDIKYAEHLTLDAAYRKYSTHIADIQGAGNCSDVIETPNFFCIVRLNDQTPLYADQNYRKWLNRSIMGTDIFGQCYDEYLDSVRTASKYHKTSKLDKIIKMMPDSSVFEGKWNPDRLSTLEGELMTFGGKSYSLREFAEYIRDNQYSTGYTKIADYVAMRYQDFLDMLTMEEASKSITGSNLYNEEMQYYGNIVYYEMLNPFQKIAREARDTAKVYKFYKESRMSYKSSHVLNIRFYDYFNEQNRKKASKLASELSANPKYAVNPSILKSGDAGTFQKGDNTLADKIIDDYDHGHYGKVFFFSDQHLMAIVDIEKKPEELPIEQVFPLVSTAYYNSKKENYIQELRTKYHLVISPDAAQVLEAMF